MQLHIKFENRDRDYDATSEVTTSLHLNAAYSCRDVFLFLCFFFLLSDTISAGREMKETYYEIINGANYRFYNGVNNRPDHDHVSATFTIGAYRVESSMKNLLLMHRSSIKQRVVTRGR